MTVQENLGKDLAIELLDARLLPVYQVGDHVKRTVVGGRGLRVVDFDTSEGRDNLGQAMIMRLLTPQGELAALGHPDYGARLYEIVGAPNTETFRNLAKLHILAALKQERRIEKIETVDVTKHPVLRDLIFIAISVLPVGADASFAISFTLELDTSAGGAT